MMNGKKAVLKGNASYMPYLIYLRKSRADAEAEARGEGETLSRHEHALLALAGRMKLEIGDIYREVVSGESIAARPQMQRLLSEVEGGQWEGVLVMEVERLARGDSIDQGLVLQAFKYSGTKMITPAKTYDPNNEFDEEYFEFGLFMSRREYKTINRRMQRGREASIKEGKFVGSIAPYGYRRVRLENQKGWTLEPVEDQAEVIRMIFDFYVNGEAGAGKRYGIQALAKRLNELRITPARSDYWLKSTIRDILINPVYIGKLRWKWRPVQYKIVNGEKVAERHRNYDEDCILADGLHPAIVERDLFERAQMLLAEAPPAPVGYQKNLINPLAGLIYCGFCGRSMVYRKGSGAPGKYDYIVCHARACSNVGSAYHYVEERLLDSLREWLDEYKLGLKASQKNTDSSATLKNALKKLRSEIVNLQKQQGSLHDLLEQGVYDTETFITRTRDVAERLRAAQENEKRIEEELVLQAARTEVRMQIVPKAERLLKVYHDVPTANEKNELLRGVIDRAVYTKTVRAANNQERGDKFDLVLYPKIPKHNP